MANHPLDNMHDWSSSEARQLYQKHYDQLLRAGMYPGSIVLMFKDLLIGGILEVRGHVDAANEEE